MSSTREILLWLCTVFTLVIANHSFPNAQPSSVNTLTCDGLKTKSQMNNFSIYNFSASDNHLNICVNNGSTCCSQQMEHHLHKFSVKILQTIRTVKTDLIKKIFNEGRTKFDDFFQDLINESEKMLDKRFMGIYKSVYANNTHITRAFYSNLRKYYSDGRPNPKEIIKAFFQEVLKKIFVLLNGGTIVDVDCVGKTLDKVTPFGVVPRRLTIQVERSFTAARMFVYGMKSGKIVVDRLTERELSKECLKSVTKMTQCSLCVGHNNVKPCAGYCKSVFGECFESLMELSKVWDDYLKQMQNLALKLEGPYDIDAVASDMAFEISDGIMNFQRANPKVSPQIKKLCQKGGRTTRSLTSSDTSDFFLETNERMKRATNKASKTHKRPSLDSLTRPYREHFDKLKKFWSKLPEAMCDETVVADNVTDKYCWDGLKLVNNSKFVQPRRHGLPVNNGKNDVEIKILVNKLNSVIQNLKTAISGNNIPEDDDFSGSGSASGSGVSGDYNEIPTVFEEKIGEPYTDPYSNTPKTNCVNCIPDNGDPDLQGVGRGMANSLFLSILVLTATSLLHLVL